MASQMLATKPLNVIMEEAKDTGEYSLRRALGPMNLITLGIGAIIGAGIFVLDGPGRSDHRWARDRGLVYFVGHHLCIRGPLLRGVRVPNPHRRLGLHLWLRNAGRNFRLDHRLGPDPRIRLWRGNGGFGMERLCRELLDDFGLHIGPRWIATPGTEMVFYRGHWAALGSLQQALASAGIDPATLPHAVGVFNSRRVYRDRRLATFILVVGIKESANFNSAIVILKVAIVLVFIAVAGMFVLRHPALAAANWHPFIPPNTGKFGVFGLSGVARGAAVIFFAYIGFDAVSTAAQEAKNPQKDMPIGIIGSLVICTVLYIAGVGPADGRGSLHRFECRRSRRHRH